MAGIISLVDRLADLAEQLAEGKCDDLIRILYAQKKIVHFNKNDGILIIMGDDFTCNICLGADPIDQAPGLMMALFGPLGATQMYKGLIKELTRRHKEKHKKGEANAKKGRD